MTEFFIKTQMVKYMLEAFEITHYHPGDLCLNVILTFDERKKSRYRTQTTCGKDFGWFVERGIVLSHGQVLKCKDGTLIQIQAAEEEITRVTCDDALLLTRAAYHLGNRHVPLQVEKEYLCYLRDHVLDEMVVGLGLQLSHLSAPFNPENGAYGGGHGHHH